MPSALGSAPSSRIIFAAGPFTAAPPTIGETPTTGNERARSHAPMAGTLSIGAMLTYGFDGAITAARTPHACGPATLKRKSAHARPAPLPDEVVLKCQHAAPGPHARADRRFAHRHDGMPHAEPRRQRPRRGRERRPAREEPRALH